MDNTSGRCWVIWDRTWPGVPDARLAALRDVLQRRRDPALALANQLQQAPAVAMAALTRGGAHHREPSVRSLSSDVDSAGGSPGLTGPAGGRSAHAGHRQSPVAGVAGRPLDRLAAQFGARTVGVSHRRQSNCAFCGYWRARPGRSSINTSGPRITGCHRTTCRKNPGPLLPIAPRRPIWACRCSPTWRLTISLT